MKCYAGRSNFRICFLCCSNSYEPCYDFNDALQLARGKACAERVVEVLDTEIDIVNPENAFVPTEPKGEVEFKNVSFKYDPESHGDNILENISFKAKPGQIVGIVGGTGCGKSSLVNLIPRLYDATQGEVLVDGVDVKKYDLKALREMIGVVLQKMFFQRNY